MNIIYITLGHIQKVFHLWYNVGIVIWVDFKGLALLSATDWDRCSNQSNADNIKIKGKAYDLMLTEGQLYAYTVNHIKQLLNVHVLQLVNGFRSQYFLQP